MSDKNDFIELNKTLANTPSPPKAQCISENDTECEPEKKNRKIGGFTQWTTSDNKLFFPASKTRKNLPPGVYEINSSPNSGIYFQRINVRTEGLIRFPQANTERVLKEIEKFWDREAKFKQFKITYKRGIILYGPPGGGKTCCVNLLMNDVVSRSGIVIKFAHPDIFTDGLRIIREIQPKTPIVILMEDIDSILERYGDSKVLNILDGVEQVEKIVYLATTNYPEKLGARIINRPSRFDKRFKIGYPDAESRKIYLKFLCSDKNLGVDLDKWVEDTEEFTLAHLKELFTAVIVQGDEYEEALECLKSMKEDVLSSIHDETKKMGFVVKNGKPSGIGERIR